MLFVQPGQCCAGIPDQFALQGSRKEDNFGGKNPEIKKISSGLVALASEGLFSWSSNVLYDSFVVHRLVLIAVKPNQKQSNIR